MDEKRGKSKGKKLVEYRVTELKIVGFESVMTSTPSNEYFQPFYTKLGYRTIGGFLIGNEPYEMMLFKSL